MKMLKMLLAVIVLLVAACVGSFSVQPATENMGTSSFASTPSTQAEASQRFIYEDENGNSGVATYSPDGSSVIFEFDGARHVLHSSISADGARYTNGDESIVFWEKGNSVRFEHGEQVTTLHLQR